MDLADGARGRLAGLPVEHVVGSLLDSAALRAANHGVEIVFHLAALASDWGPRSRFFEVNAEGTRLALGAARAAGVRRFVHISSVVAIGAAPRKGVREDTPAAQRRVNETFEFNLGHLKIPYIMTKRAAETELMARAAEGGPELIIVNPSIIVSPSPDGRDRERVRRAFGHFVAPDYPHLVNLVDIRDLARGVLCALERGRAGQRYVMAGDNISVRDLMLSVSWLVGRTPHLVRIPRTVIDTAARWSCSWQTITAQSRVLFYPDLVKMMDYDWAYSSLKARVELGYRSRSVQETLGDYLTDNFTGSYARP